MTRLKHNKKRNTAILYETLIRELTRASAREDKERSNLILRILKENFSKQTVLGADLELYKTLDENIGCSKEIAEKILAETKKRHSEIDQNSLFREQSKVIKRVNYELGNEMFENFIPNFKKYATINQILHGAKNIKHQVRLEESVIEEMTNTPIKGEEKYKSVDKLAFKTFLNKFNEKYENTLLKEQKKLLSLYATSFQNNDLELKVFLNEEVSRLKESVQNLKIEEKKQILEVLDSFAKRPLDKPVLNKILKIQQLISEMSTNGN